MEDQHFSSFQNIIVYCPTDSEHRTINDILKHGKKLMKNPNEVAQLSIINQVYGMNCLKFNNSDFKEYIGIS